MSDRSTDDRDEELDALERGLDAPHLHMPDEIKVGDGSMCFLNGERMCNGDCTAYNWELPRVERQGHRQCVILYHLGAMSSGAIAQIHALRNQGALDRQRAEDQQRDAAASQKVPKV